MKHLLILLSLLVFSCSSSRQEHVATNLDVNAKVHTQSPGASLWPPETHLVATFDVLREDGLMIIFTQSTQANYAVDWDNDGIFDDHDITQATTHHYGKPGRYTLRIAGDLPHIQFCPVTWEEAFINHIQVVDILQWGKIHWQSMHKMFSACTSLETWSAIDKPILNEVKDMSYMFYGTEAFQQPLDDWDVSHVTDMSSMFALGNYNQPLGRWDVSHVSNMSHMFYGNHAFNQPVNDWNVSHVNNMSHMFHDAESFNQPLDQWDVKNVEDMRHMFDVALAFNQPLNTWDIKNVKHINHMLAEAASFNQPLDSWKFDSTTSLAGLLVGASAFNQPLATWDISHIKDTSYMLAYTESFDQPLDTWNVQNVETMEWMLYDSAMSTKNYDKTLRAWARQSPLKEHVTLDARGLSYCHAEKARKELITRYHWQIQHDQKMCK